MTMDRFFQEDFSDDEQLRFEKERSDKVARTVHALGTEIERLAEYARYTDRAYVENNASELLAAAARLTELACNICEGMEAP